MYVNIHISGEANDREMEEKEQARKRMCSRQGWDEKAWREGRKIYACDFEIQESGNGLPVGGINLILAFIRLDF